MTLEQSLLSDIPRLNADSQAFMRWILDRVIGIGLQNYGPWDANADARDIDKEIADELADAVVYSGMRAVMRAHKRVRVQAFIDAYDSSGLDHLFDNTDFVEEPPTGEFVREKEVAVE